MFYLNEVLFPGWDMQYPMSIKVSLLEFAEKYPAISGYTPILIPTAENDDVNGSRWVGSGGTNFTYRDASRSDIENASSLGYYEYFKTLADNLYTGIQYDGEGYPFDAIVVDPPAYAAKYTI